jgi:hypothetical protein
VLVLYCLEATRFAVACPHRNTRIKATHVRTVRAITVLFWQLIITAERDGYIEFATVITRAILSSSFAHSENTDCTKCILNAAGTAGLQEEITGKQFYGTSVRRAHPLIIRFCRKTQGFFEFKNACRKWRKVQNWNLAVPIWCTVSALQDSAVTLPS